MVAFEVYVNGERVCLAGVGPDGVLNAIVSWVGGGRRGGGGTRLQVGGLDCRVDEHMSWSHRELAAGDEVWVRVVEAREADPPAERKRSGR